MHVRNIYSLLFKARYFKYTHFSILFRLETKLIGVHYQIIRNTIKNNVSSNLGKILLRAIGL